MIRFKKKTQNNITQFKGGDYVVLVSKNGYDTRIYANHIKLGSMFFVCYQDEVNGYLLLKSHNYGMYLVSCEDLISVKEASEKYTFKLDNGIFRDGTFALCFNVE